jgi:hypothetical protein
MTMDHRMIAFLDLSTGEIRSGQWWSDAPLVTGRTAVWLVVDGRPVHVHKVAKRHRDTVRALRDRTDVPTYITGVPVRAAWSDAYVGRYDLTPAA